jgi:hypothetical protein
VTLTNRFRPGETRLRAGKSAEVREAECDDENFAHFHFPDFGSDDHCRLPEPDGFLVWDGLAKARDAAFPRSRRLQRLVLVDVEALSLTKASINKFAGNDFAGILGLGDNADCPVIDTPDISGRSRLHAGKSTEGSEAESDSESFAHFQFPGFVSGDCCRLPEPDGFLVWDGFAKARDAAFPRRRRLQRRILLNPEALLQLAGENRPTMILNVGTRSRIAKNVGLTFHMSG